MSDKQSNDIDHDRRKFMATAGKFAVVVPPVMTALLSTTMNSASIAASSTYPTKKK